MIVTSLPEFASMFESTVVVAFWFTSAFWLTEPFGCQQLCHQGHDDEDEKDEEE